jgi:hypothetical protein
MVAGEASNLFEEFIVKGNRKVPITVAMINKDRKRFDDFSSLVLTWESSDEVPSFDSYAGTFLRESYPLSSTPP